jgi:predicted nucleic acid-binding protein
VDLIIDASSIINLDNAQALELVAGLSDRTIWLSPLVIGECKPTCAARIVQLEKEGLIRFVNPESVSAETFLSLLETYDLGEGETECLALSLGHPYVMCCDDSKARRIGTKLLGPERVIGSLGLLKCCVSAELISPKQAFDLYELMKKAGGFLPLVASEWFSQPD